MTWEHEKRTTERKDLSAPSLDGPDGEGGVRAAPSESPQPHRR